MENLLLIGGDNNAKLFIKESNKGIFKKERIVGILDNNISKGTKIEGIEVLGKIIDLPEIVKEHNINCLIQSSHFEQAINLINFCRANKIKYKMVPFIAGIYSKNIKEEHKGNLILLTLKETPLSGFNLAIKRVFDFFGALFLIIILSPLFLIISFLLKLEDMKAPVFITEKRWNGYKDKVFKMFRFRTLPKGEREKITEYKYDEVTEHLDEIKNDKRATKLGRFLRISNISELPQLFNVLKGEMSLIGPRPPYKSEVEQYDDITKKRLLIFPGMTGLWQVSRKKGFTFKEMFELDTFYIENWSFWLDLLIIFKTIKEIFNFQKR